jgi:hypothetical protein
MTYITERPTHIFDHTTTEAQIGDYFRLPYQPTFRVVAVVDLGDIVSYLVQSGSNTPEQWDIMKPETELVEQERNRVEAETEEYEREMSAIIYQSSKDEILEAIGLLEPLTKYDWLPEPIGADMTYIFGMSGEEMAEALPPVETGYHNENWTADGCEF